MPAGGMRGIGFSPRWSGPFGAGIRRSCGCRLLPLDAGLEGELLLNPSYDLVIIRQAAAVELDFAMGFLPGASARALGEEPITITAQGSRGRNSFNTAERAILALQPIDPKFGSRVGFDKIKFGSGLIHQRHDDVVIKLDRCLRMHIFRTMNVASKNTPGKCVLYVINIYVELCCKPHEYG